MKIKGIKLYEEVVLNQNKEYLGKEFKSGVGHIEIDKMILDFSLEFYVTGQNKTYLNAFNKIDLREFMRTEWEEVKLPVNFAEAMKSNGVIKSELTNACMPVKSWLDLLGKLCITDRQKYIDSNWYLLN